MNKYKAGFKYTITHLRGEEVISEEIQHNLIPTEGLNYIIGTSAAAVAQITAWYLGIYEGNYTPVAGDTMSTFPGSSTESTAYTEATRVAWTAGTVSAGAVSNSASAATFTINATKTIYGAFMSSVSTKSATTGTLLSAVLFASPKAVVSGDILNITSTLTLVAV